MSCDTNVQYKIVLTLQSDWMRLYAGELHKLHFPRPHTRSLGTDYSSDPSNKQSCMNPYAVYVLSRGKICTISSARARHHTSKHISNKSVQVQENMEVLQVYSADQTTAARQGNKSRRRSARLDPLMRSSTLLRRHALLVDAVA